MDNKIIDWEELLDFNDEKEEPKNIEIYPLEAIYEDKQFEIYKNDYNKLVSVESIIKSKSYYQTKYAIIAKHIINMDDYNVILQRISKESFEESILSKSITIFLELERTILLGKKSGGRQKATPVETTKST